MAASFTVFEKLGDATLLMTDEELAMFNNAVMLYGMHGREVDLPHPVDVYFALVRGDIDNSKEARGKGARMAAARWGKDAPKKRDAREDEQHDAAAYERADERDDARQDACDDAQHDAPAYARAPENCDTQTKINQASTDHKKGVCGRFRAPTAPEVRAYAAEYAAAKGLDPGGFDAERFVDYYASNGWKVGRNAMRDWRAAARDWVRRDCAAPGKGAGDEYSAL